MPEETKIRDRRPAGNPRFLLCDPTGTNDPSTPEEQWAFSPIRCLDKAVDENPLIVVVRFGQMPIRERTTLVELCAVLKRNSHTRDYPLLALLRSKHRGLIEDLERAQVDYVRYIDDAGLEATRIREIIAALGPDDRVERQLARLCRYLHYDAVDAGHEIIVCGAYLDRMVLGGRWLHEVCETEEHLHCQYYLNPRKRS
jgi:hypothetical protein